VSAAHSPVAVEAKSNETRTLQDGNHMSVGQGARVNCYQRPVNLIEIARRTSLPDTAQKVSSDSFKDMFSQELARSREVVFSKHAQQRLFSRGIRLSDETLNHIADAIDKARDKGARETLILADDTAFVVSVENRTVVTAFDREHLRQGIVTSIDSAVII
jgi:flagellar operon protein